MFGIDGRTRQRGLRWAGWGLIAALMATYGGCSSGGSSGSGGATSYQGPGSHYTFELAEDGTFRVEVSDDPSSPTTLTVEGTYARLATGFLDMTVTSASGVDAPSPGDQAIALEVPGFALLLKPLDANGEIIPMVVAGDCPATGFTGNWFQTSCRDLGVDCGADDAGRGWMGEFNYDALSGMANVTFEHNLVTGAPLTTSPIGGATCDAGIMDVGGARIYLTDSGGAIVYTNPNDDANSNHIVAVPQEALTPSDLAGDYAGLVFEGDAGGTLSVNATIDAGGLSGTIYDVDESALEIAANGAPVATMAFSSANDIATTATPGWLTGTLDNGTDPVRPFYCMADVDVATTSRDLVLCVGQSPGDPTRHFNVVLVSKS